MDNITWMDISLFLNLQNAVDSRSLEKMRGTLQYYNSINRALYGIQVFRPHNTAEFKRQRVGIFGSECKDSLLKIVVALYQDTPGGRLIRIRPYNNWKVKDRLSCIDYFSEADTLVFLSNLPSNLGGLQKEVKFFNKIVEVLEKKRPLTSIFIVDCHPNAKFDRLLKIFKAFVPLSSINSLPNIFTRTNTKVLQMKWSKGECVNIKNILKEIAIVPFLKKNFICP